jgi:hypothetical protein
MDETDVKKLIRGAAFEARTLNTAFISIEDATIISNAVCDGPYPR